MRNEKRASHQAASGKEVAGKEVGGRFKEVARRCLGGRRKEVAVGASPAAATRVHRWVALLSHQSATMGGFAAVEPDQAITQLAATTSTPPPTQLCIATLNPITN